MVIPKASSSNGVNGVELQEPYQWNKGPSRQSRSRGSRRSRNVPAHSSYDTSKGAAHPVNLTRIWLAILLIISWWSHSSMQELFELKQCNVTNVLAAQKWLKMTIKGLTLFAIIDILGAVIGKYRHSGIRWWGSREKRVVCLCLWCSWIIFIYIVVHYGLLLFRSHFTCYKGYMITTLVLGIPFLAIFPLYWCLIEDETPSANRYVPQEDIEDELEDLAEDPIVYQVWKSGKLLYRSTKKNEVRRWMQMNLESVHGVVVREVSFT